MSGFSADVKDRQIKELQDTIDYLREELERSRKAMRELEDCHEQSSRRVAVFEEEL